MRKYLFNETKMDSIKIFKETKMKGILETVLEKAEDERSFFCYMALNSAYKKGAK